MNELHAELDRRIDERVEHLNAARGWPWQEPGVVSVGLDDDGRITRYLAIATGLVGFGPVEQ